MTALIILAVLGVITVGFVCYLAGRDHGYQAGCRDSEANS